MTRPLPAQAFVTSGARRGPRPTEFRVRAHADPLGTVEAAEPEVMDEWLSSLGPTAAVIWQYLARLSKQGEFACDADELVQYTGTSEAVVWKALDRLGMFSRIVWTSATGCTVEVLSQPPRRRVPRVAS